jgi:hypothetical protein
VAGYEEPESGTRYERLITPLLAAIAVCGFLMIALSFLPWVSFSSIDVEVLSPVNLPDTSIPIAGTETSRLRDTEVITTTTIREEDEWCSCRVAFGDGYITAALGLAIVGAAAVAFFTGRAGIAGSVGAVAGLISLLLTGYNAMGIWEAFAWTTERHSEVLEGTITVGLWALVAVSGLASIIGVALFTLARRAEAEDEDYVEYEEDAEDYPPERLNAWA